MPCLPKGERQTPLSIASSEGYEEIVKMLLDHPKIDVNKQLNGGYETVL